MKKWLVIFILFLVSVALADDVTYTQGQVISSNGHKVTVTNIGQYSVIFDVDGTKGIVPLSQETKINGVSIIVDQIFYTDEISSRYIGASISATAQGTVTNGCGDGVCSAGEDSTNCCTDCGCSRGNSCVNNQCLKDACNSDEDCWNIPNRDFCLSYKCTGAPKKCVTTPITECVVNDRCCPANCYYPDDPDCPPTKINPNKPATQNIPVVNNASINLPVNNQSNVVNQEQKSTGFIARILAWILSWFKR